MIANANAAPAANTPAKPEAPAGISISQATPPNVRTRGLVTTLYGSPGTGKTTLAATFEKPFIIRIEDGTNSISHMTDVAVSPVVQTSDDVFTMVRELATQDHPYLTIVFDTISQLDTMVASEVVKAAGVAGINDVGGGYGRGPSAVAQRLNVLREWCDKLCDRNIDVVFLAHDELETCTPEDSAAYDVRTLKVGKGSRGAFVNNADIVGLIRLQKILKDEKGHMLAKTSGERELLVTTQLNAVTKNRLGITDILKVKLGENPLASYIGG